MPLRRNRHRRRSFEREAVPHMAALFRMALALARSPDAAEDMVQETYTQAWRSFDRYSSGTDCKAWLFRILFRVRSAQVRRRNLQLVDIEKIPEERVATEPDAPRRLREAEILKVIDSLPEHYRTVVVLADAEQFGYKEICRMLDLPMGTVMSRLNRGRRLFREKFRKENPGEAQKA